MSIKRVLLTMILFCMPIFLCGCENGSPDPQATPTLTAGTDAISGIIDAQPTVRANYNINYTSAQLLFDEDYQMKFSAGFQDIANLSETVIGNRFYSLMHSGNIIYYDANANEYAVLTNVPVKQSGPRYQGVKYSDLDEFSKQELNHTVSQLIAAVDSDVLYGYNRMSGRIGAIDKDGVHWNDVLLDNSLIIQEDPMNADPLWHAYIEGNTLYTYWEPAWWDENAVCNGAIMAFDIQTGRYAIHELTDTYTICPYKDKQMLLLRRAADGAIYLSAYDLATFSITEDTFPSLPISVSMTSCIDVTHCVSRLAYHEASDSIVCATADGLWQSIRGSGFQQVKLNATIWDELNSMGTAWIMENGVYIIPNNGKYMIS